MKRKVQTAPEKGTISRRASKRAVQAAMKILHSKDKSKSAMVEAGRHL